MTDTPPLLFDTHCHLDAAGCRRPRRASGAGAPLAWARCWFRRSSRPILPTPCHARATAAGWRWACTRCICLRHRPAHLEQLADWLDRERPMPWAKSAGFLPAGTRSRPTRGAVCRLTGWRARQLPVVLQLRRAQDRVLKYLRQVGVPGGIAHAFNGSRQQAEAFIALGSSWIWGR